MKPSLVAILCFFVFVGNLPFSWASWVQTTEQILDQKQTMRDCFKTDAGCEIISTTDLPTTLNLCERITTDLELQKILANFTRNENETVLESCLKEPECTKFVKECSSCPKYCIDSTCADSCIDKNVYSFVNSGMKRNAKKCVKGCAINQCGTQDCNCVDVCKEMSSYAVCSVEMTSCFTNVLDIGYKVVDTTNLVHIRTMNFECPFGTNSTACKEIGSIFDKKVIYYNTNDPTKFYYSLPKDISGATGLESAESLVALLMFLTTVTVFCI